jgi:hypothetical protein
MFESCTHYILKTFLQFDEPTEDLPEFIAEEEAGFKGELFSFIFF